MKTRKLRRVKIKRAGFQVLSHPSDIGLKVAAKNLAQIFLRAVNGVYFLLFGPAVFLPELKPQRKILTISGLDYEQLLIKLLNEIIFLATVKRQFSEKIDIKEISPKKLKVELVSRYLAKENVFLREIKSATYQNLKIVQKKSGFSVRIVFDT